MAMTLEGMEATESGKTASEYSKSCHSKAPILILDEVTSSVDRTEKLIEKAWIAHERQNHLVIAHRLSTVRNADKIIVLKRV